MLCAFVGAGIGNFIRCKLSKHHFTLFLCIASSVSAACLVYAGLLKAAEILWAIQMCIRDSCVLGYPDEETAEAKPRKDDYVFWVE